MGVLGITRKWLGLEEKGVTFISGADGTRASGNQLYLGRNQRAVDNNSIVMAAVHWQMRNVTQATPIVEMDSKDGAKVVVGHQASEMVRRPQAGIKKGERTRLTGRRLLAATVFSLTMDGNAYFLKVRNGAGRVIGLDWIPWHAVEPVERKDMAGVVDYYRLSMRVNERKIDPEDIVHHQVGIDPHNPVKGFSPLKSLMRQIMTDNEIAIYSHAVIRQPSPGLLISPQAIKDGMGSISQDDADYLSEKFAEKASGEKAGGVIVPTHQMKIDRLRFSPDEMAIDKINKLPEQRIAAVLGIPAVVLGLGAGLERSTYSNMSEAREAATEEFLVPFWEDLSDTLTDELLPEFSTKVAERFAFDISKVRSLQEDEDAKHDRVREDFASNLINRAEARVMLGKEPQTGDERVYAYMLRPSPALPAGLPQGPKQAKSVRDRVEKK